MVSSIITPLHERKAIVQSLIAISLVLAFAANLYGLFAGITCILPQLFYLPLILFAFFFPRRGILFALLLSAAYLLMAAIVQPGNTAGFLSAAAGCVVFVIVAAAVSYLSGRAMAREAELSKAKDEWERTFDAVPDLIALIDRDHRIIRVNKAMADSLGISPHQAAGVRCYEIVHHSSAPPLHCPHAMLLKDGKDHAEEIHEDTIGGDFMVSTSPLYGTDGSLVGSVHVARDITKRKQAEAALFENKEKFRTLVESSFDGIAIHQNGILVYVNKTAARLLGAEDPGVFIGKPAIDVVAPAFRKSTEKRVEQAPDKALELVREQFIRLDGTTIDVDVTTAPSIWEGKPAAYVTFRDITAQVRAEKALRESEEKYRTIINEMQDIFYRTDLEGKITMLSPSAAKLAGYDSNDELIGQDVTWVYADPAVRNNLLTALRENGSVYAYPIDLKVRDGAIRHVTTSSHFYRDQQGTILGVEGVIHDITKLRQAEDALRESEERYRTIIENIQDVYFRFDRESRLVMVSPSAAPTFGFATAAEMLGRPAQSLWKDPKAREQLIETMRKQGGFVQDWEAEFVKSDGTVFWASVSGHLHTDRQGKYNGSEGIIRNISERKKMEEALKGALAKLNMLSSITRHDILNQIMGLRTFLQISREDLQGTGFEANVEKEDQIAEAIQRQIEFTRYYQDIGVNAPKWQGVEAVIREAAEELTLPSIDLQIDISGVEIFADPLIEKVFFNLMENSLRHGERVTRMSFSSRRSAESLIITYRDNGVGIPAEDKKRLFQRGFGKHTGLGLFLSREILAITGVTIQENGEPGKGVQFELTFPPGAFRFLS